VAVWLASAAPRDRLTAWLSLDQNDNNPTAFWTYVTAALQAVAPTVGTGSLALIDAAQTPIELVIGTLLNELQDAVTASVARIKGARVAEVPAAARKLFEGTQTASLTRCATQPTSFPDGVSCISVLQLDEGAENLAPANRIRSSVPDRPQGLACRASEHATGDEHRHLRPKGGSAKVHHRQPQMRRNDVQCGRWRRWTSTTRRPRHVTLCA
jgi:hypothetical protein